jgi:hypothetical protein
MPANAAQLGGPAVVLVDVVGGALVVVPPAEE